MTFGAREAMVVPPLQGRQGLLRLLLTLRAGHEPDGAGPTDVADAMARAGRLARARGLVVVISDFRGSRAPREQELPAVGDLWLVDPETGRQLRVDTGRRKIRERSAARAAEEREELE